MITNLEAQLLANIARNEFAPGNGAHPVNFEDCGEVWANCLDCGPCEIPSRSIPGIMASLVKKGLARTDGDTVALTQTGYAAYDAAHWDRIAEQEHGEG